MDMKFEIWNRKETTRKTGRRWVDNIKRDLSAIELGGNNRAGLCGEQRHLVAPAGNQNTYPRLMTTD
jgi:hypothetical protein